MNQAIDAVLAANAKTVFEAKEGKEKALNALIGQVMKATKGHYNPDAIRSVVTFKIGLSNELV
jgi:aspartyl-tRNA(Asn)/glutamyl-tRNA(Gln) amidotransferase subunit B